MRHITHDPRAHALRERAILRALAYREQNDGEARKLLGVLAMFAVCFVMAWMLL